MKKPANLTFEPRVLGNGHNTFEKGKSKFMGTFKHKFATETPTNTGAKKVVGRSK